MGRIIFIEGVSGSGKTITVRALQERLQSMGYSAKCYIEDDVDSPLDLCWAAYLTESEYDAIKQLYPEFIGDMEENIIFRSEYVILRYKTSQMCLYSPELYSELLKREFCYFPTRVVPLAEHNRVFSDLWNRFAAVDRRECDYIIFDATLGHVINGLVRNYDASSAEIKSCLSMLIDIVRPLNPIVFYLMPENAGEYLVKARQIRGQPPLTYEQLEFWRKRKSTDLRALTSAGVEFCVESIVDYDWSNVLTGIIAAQPEL